MTVVASLALSGAALAHVSVRPGLLESGREETLRIELPELRPGLQPSALDVSGAGVRQLESVSVGRLGAESRWQVRLDVATEPGPLSLQLRARYADGRSVTVRQALTVLPDTAAEQSSRPELAAVAGVLVFVAAIAASLALRRSRMRR